MKIYIVIIIILHSVTLSNTFSTSLGQCSIQIHEGEVAQITELINKTIKGLSENQNNNSKIEKEVRAEVIELCSRFPIYKHLR